MCHEPEFSRADGEERGLDPGAESVSKCYRFTLADYPARRQDDQERSTVLDKRLIQADT